MNWFKNLVCKSEMNEIGYLKEDLREVLDEVEKLKVIHSRDEFADYWNFKRTPRDIYYKGRTLPNSKKMVNLDIRQLVVTNDFMIKNDIRKHRLFIKNPMKCDADIVKIYIHTKENESHPYKYATDEQIFGASEFWMFPFELREYKIGDCDDWAIEMASYLIQAGVPSFRVRCVAGMTHSGFGHLTTYVLGDDMKNWYHLNSTSPWYKRSQLWAYPKSNDPMDSIGIKDVWFSFNNVHTWSEFETTAAAKEFRLNEKKIVIA